MYFLLDLIQSGLTGLEPAASALTGRCSNQLNYNPREIRDLAKNLIFIFVWGISEGQGDLYHLMVDWLIFGPSWI